MIAGIAGGAGIAAAVCLIALCVWLGFRTRDARESANPAPPPQPTTPPESALPLGFDDETPTYLRLLAPGDVERWDAEGENSDGRSSYQLALCYGHGIHRPENRERAVQLLLKSASAGVPAAQYTLARAYLDGKWTARDILTGRIWLREAAATVPRAAFELGERYDADKDALAAAGWYYRAARLGHPPARKKVIELIVADGIPPDDADEVLAWANDLIRAEQFPAAHYIAGVIHADRNESEQASASFESAAEKGYAGAMFRLAQMYALGSGVTADQPRCVFWLRKAADNDDGRAQVLLAEVLHKGLYGQAADVGAARALITRAERAPSAEVLYLLGTYYRDTEIDRTKSIAAFRQAGNKGHFTAQIILIELLGADANTRSEAQKLGHSLASQGYQGAQLAYARLLLQYGTTHFYPTPAHVYLRQAAVQGLPAAQYELGMAYLDGRGGLTADPVEATRWLMVVVNNVEARTSSPTEWAGAVFQLAECYEKGRGVPRDSASADILYEQAAKAGRPRPERQPQRETP